MEVSYFCLACWLVLIFWLGWWQKVPKESKNFSNWFSWCILNIDSSSSLCAACCLLNSSNLSACLASQSPKNKWAKVPRRENRGKCEKAKEEKWRRWESEKAKRWVDERAVPTRYGQLVLPKIGTWQVFVVLLVLLDARFDPKMSQNSANNEKWKRFQDFWRNKKSHTLSPRPFWLG